MREREGKKCWQRIYQYLYNKQDVMVVLIPFSTFDCANHTRGSIRVNPPVTDSYQAMMLTKINTLYTSFGHIIQVNKLCKANSHKTRTQLRVTRRKIKEQEEINKVFSIKEEYLLLSD